jgi:signal transduction histidine kinase
VRLLRNVSSLRVAVIALVLLPLLAVLGVGGTLVLSTLERRVEKRMQDDIALIARTLREPLGRSLERRREHSLARSVRSASQFDRVYGVYLYDSSGTLIARADPLPTRRSGALAHIDVASGEAGRYDSVGGHEVYSYFTPLTGAGGQTVGMLQVTRAASEIHDYLTSLRVDVALIMLGFAIPSVAIMVFGYHVVIGRPLQRLAVTMEYVADGDAGARAAVTGPEEIRRLAYRFNSMLGGMAERDSVLNRERAEQARLEQKLRESEKHALVGRLAAGVAHELGAPLSVVDGHAQRLMRSTTSDSAEHAMLRRIRESSARMASIVRQLLDFGNNVSLAPKSVSVRRLVLLSAADVRPQFEKRAAQLEIVAGAPAVRVMAEERRLCEALAHLLRNALHASAGARVRIGWEDRQHQGVRIFVENSGAPIPAEDHSRIFEPFYTTKEPGEGSGLGLAIVSATVVDHGADIAVYDSPLGGAGFGITFRRAAEEAEST